MLKCHVSHKNDNNKTARRGATVQPYNRTTEGVNGWQFHLSISTLLIVLILVGYTKKKLSEYTSTIIWPDTNTRLHTTGGNNSPTVVLLYCYSNDRALSMIGDSREGGKRIYQKARARGLSSQYYQVGASTRNEPHPRQGEGDGRNQLARALCSWSAMFNFFFFVPQLVVQ